MVCGSSSGKTMALGHGRVPIPHPVSGPALQARAMTLKGGGTVPSGCGPGAQSFIGSPRVQNSHDGEWQRRFHRQTRLMDISQYAEIQR